MEREVLSNIHRMMMCLVAAWTMLAVNAAEMEKLQAPSAAQPTVVPDSLLSAARGAVAVDTVSMLNADSIYILNKVDSVGVKQKKAKRDWATWSPDPKRAMWLAIVLPGAGQVYNRKYWKLPIVYGGFLGCIYAWRWNNQMFRDYSQAYMDIMDDDPNTQSYNQFLHLGMQITDENKERYQNLFKRRKDYYRKYRDLSIFCMIGVYALSVIDAYVDAALSQFDISKDLSLKIEPSVMNDRRSANPLKSSALGLQCSLNF
ncbi:DUF5683 domain-containing protein [uncultured Prevotella sp.]|uniref:DUF5683 domain-containing protein n=1 Tax=uncultured Prevotella sp. TaxID=159272 RepID=UPI00258EE180|nr:DUF5683 domain-containing protein [uncultured Prevotella sp.]